MDKDTLLGLVNDEIGVTVAFWTSTPRDIFAFIVGFLSLVTIFQFISPISFVIFWIILGLLIFSILLASFTFSSYDTQQFIEDHFEISKGDGKIVGLGSKPKFSKIYFDFLREIHLISIQPAYLSTTTCFLTLPLCYFGAVIVGILPFDIFASALMFSILLLILYILKFCLPLFDNIYQFKRAREFYILNAVIFAFGMLSFLILSLTYLSPISGTIPQRILFEYYGPLNINLWGLYSIIVVIYQILFGLIILYLAASAQSATRLREKFKKLNEIKTRIIVDDMEIEKAYGDYLIAKMYGVSISPYLRIFALSRIYFILTDQDLENNLELFQKYFSGKKRPQLKKTPLLKVSSLFKFYFEIIKNTSVKRISRLKNIGKGIISRFFSFHR